MMVIMFLCLVVLGLLIVSRWLLNPGRSVMGLVNQFIPLVAILCYAAWRHDYFVTSLLFVIFSLLLFPDIFRGLALRRIRQLYAQRIEGSS